MKKNILIPFALIAVLGILAMIILSVVGLDKQHEIANPDEGEETVDADPEALSKSCIGCHGGDLGGTDTAPSLQDVGSKYEQEEIQQIIKNGIEGTAMPGGLVTDGEAKVLAEWLAQKE